MPVFISYSHKDQEAADAVCRQLELAGIDCWIAPRNITPGEEWAAEIIKGLERASAMVLVFSSKSDASPQVRREVERAASRDLPIIPFKIEPIMPSGAMEYFISAAHWLDATTPPLTARIEELASVIRSLAARAEHARRAGPAAPSVHGPSAVVSTVPGSEVVATEPIEHSEARVARRNSNCLLSEWDALGARKWLPWSRAATWLPLSFFAAAVMAVLLSIFSHADFMGLQVIEPGTAPTYVLYGYVAELNAGPFYLIVAPIFAWLSCRFLTLANDAIQALPLRLSPSSKLLTAGQSEAEQNQSLDAVAARNRRVWKVYLLAPAIALLLVYPPEIHSLFDARRGTLASDADYQPVVMGYVQTPYFSRWSEHVVAPGATHYGQEVSEVRRARARGAVIAAFPKGPMHGVREAAFWVFLFWALALQAMFTTFVIWMLLKVIRVIWMLYKMLPTASSQDSDAVRPEGAWPVIDADFSDSNCRYGLATLDEVYRSMFALIILLGIALVLNLGTNMAKGTAVQQGGNTFNLVGQFLIRVLPYTMWAVFFVMPMWIYRTRLRDARQARVRDLASRIRQATATQQSTRNFQETLGQVLKQTTWPAGDYAFYVLCVLATTLLVVLPFSMYRVPFLAGAPGHSNVADTIVHITDFLRGIISRLYGL